MKRSYFKQVILAFFVVILLSISYLFFLCMYKLSTTKEYDPNDLELKVKGINNIVVKDTLPLSDKMGKTIDVSEIDDGIEGYVEFTIKNKSNMDTNYEIYMKKNEVEKEIDVHYVKFYLTDADNNPLGIYNNNYSPTYYSLNYLEDKPEASSIYKGEISGNSEKKFKLRSWVSDGYSFHKEERTFSFYIDIRPI